MFWTWSLTIISPAKISRRMISKLWGSNKLMWKTPQVWLWHICDPLDLLRCNPCALKTHIKLTLHSLLKYLWNHCEMLLKYLSGTSGALSAWFRTSLGFPTKSPVGVVVNSPKAKKKDEKRTWCLAWKSRSQALLARSTVRSRAMRAANSQRSARDLPGKANYWWHQLLSTEKSLENWKP